MSTIDIGTLPGLKEIELEALGKCAVCRQPQLGADQGITFYKVTILRAAFDRRSIERRIGLQMMVGSGPLAQLMGPNEDLAKAFAGPVSVFLHEACAHEIFSILSLMPKEESARS